MRFEFAWGAGILAVIIYSLALAWVDMSDRAYLHDDRITACRPPGDQGEKLVATLRKSADGSNTDDNIQLLCKTCNLSKGAKHPIDFMQSKGFLL